MPSAGALTAEAMLAIMMTEIYVLNFTSRLTMILLVFKKIALSVTMHVLHSKSLSPSGVAEILAGVMQIDVTSADSGFEFGLEKMFDVFKGGGYPYAQNNIENSPNGQIFIPTAKTFEPVNPARAAMAELIALSNNHLRDALLSRPKIMLNGKQNNFKS